MEIRVNIPQNDYVQPTEVREEIVQKICDVFLDRRGGGYYNVFHPFCDGCYRAAHRGLLSFKGSNKPFEFGTPDSSYDYIRIHGCEMKAAFEVLIKAGYHMFRIYDYDSWMGYICDQKPFRQGATEVRSFDDFID